MSDKEEPHIKTAEPGYPFAEQQLRQQTRAVYGGVSWPGKRPGFAVVLAMGREKHFDSYDVYLLDEFESADIRLLVRQCGVLDCKYQPKTWVGDTKSMAADCFIREMNAEKQTDQRLWGEQYLHMPAPRIFSLAGTLILEMERPYEYILPTLKALLDKDRRQLYLKTSKAIEYLSQIKADEIPFTEFGEFPAIEALCFAVIEMRNWESQDLGYDEVGQDDSLATSYAIRTHL
jgi:hypothetical protein